MSTITPTQPIESPNLSEWIPSPLFRMSLEQYEAMVDSGAFTKHDRMHLINGYLVAKMTKKPPHVVSCELTRAAIDGLLPAGWHTRISDPVRLPPDSEPEPDHAVIRGSIRDFSDHHPSPANVALIVEVADSSLPDDRKMAHVYGSAGIPIYWIVNLVDRQVEVYSGPISTGYSSRVDFHPGERVPVVLDGAEIGFIAVDDIMP
jgi:Uma2 family endonuclease